MRKIKCILLMILSFFSFGLSSYATEQCVYEGKNGDGENTVIKIETSETDGVNKVKFSAYENSKLKYETAEFNVGSLVEENTSSLVIPHIVTIPGTTHYVYLSSSALNQVKNGACPYYAYYEVEIKDGFCFQNASDGDFCKNKNDKFFQLTNTAGDTSHKPIGGEDPTITIEKPENICEGIFYKNGVKTEFGNFLAGVLKLIRYAAPLLVLALSSVDFLKAVISQNKDELTKATKNSALRLILAIILFFVPVLINYLLILFFGIADPTCGLL